jgi:hypothetical protein
MTRVVCGQNSLTIGNDIVPSRSEIIRAATEEAAIKKAADLIGNYNWIRSRPALHWQMENPRSASRA